MWNAMTMNHSQISQQISLASKRDSSIMMGITVGTLTFLPGTAIAVCTDRSQFTPLLVFLKHTRGLMTALDNLCDADVPLGCSSR